MADLNDLITAEEAGDIFSDVIGPPPSNYESLTPYEAGGRIIKGSTGFGGGTSYNQPDSNAPPVQVTYQFLDGGPSFSFTPDQIAATQHALAQWSDVANVKFVQVNGRNDSPYLTYDAADLVFRNYLDPLGSDAASAGEIIGFNLLNSDGSDVGLGGSDLKHLIHETGHAIGLKHPGDYNSPSDNPDTPFDERLNGPTYAHDRGYVEDSKQYSIMSYFSALETGATHGSASISTPLLDDIVAAQRLYGANLGTRTGNDVYGFNSNVYGGGGAAFHIDSADQEVVFAIWDAGGNDTLDLSGYTQEQFIDLAPGSFTSAGGLKDNIALAEAVDSSGNIRGSEEFDRDAIVNHVENAIGGSTTDHIYGNEIGNRIEGREGWDFLYGNGGRDTLLGGGGKDYLDGGSGDDYMAGGAGDDTYIVDAGDTIVEDVFVQSRAADGTIIREDGGIDTVVTEQTTYNLDPNVENLSFSYHDPFTPAPTFRGNGNELNNVIKGGGGDDILSGGDGNDRLVGYGGADTMYGGMHDDTYVVDDVGDKVIETAGDYRRVTTDFGTFTVFVPGGTDTIETTLNYYNLTSNDVENLTFVGQGNFQGFGNSLNNVITGGTGANMLLGFGGDDTLVGFGGRDQLYGGSDNDTLRVGGGIDAVNVRTLNGGSGNDTLDFSTLDAKVDFDLGQRSLSITESADPDTTVPPRAASAANMNIISIENVTGTVNEDKITGDAGANVINGNDGSDRINGGAGNDTLVGGAGRDHFIYEGSVATIGVDTIFGGGIDGNDYGYDDELDFSGLNGSVTVDLAAGWFTASDGAATVTSGPIQNVQHVTGTANADTLTGDDDGNTFDGGLGADVMAGGDASDTYFVRDAGDQVIEKAGEGTMDQVQTTLAAYTLAPEIENLISVNVLNTDPLDFHGIGNDQDNRIYSGLGNDTLEGGAGNDYLDGDSVFGTLDGASNDTLIGGADDDTLNVFHGEDTLVFGDGWGADKVYGFTHGSDLLDMRGVTGLTSIDDLDRSLVITTEYTGTRISFGSDNWIDLIDVSPDTVTTADFWFAGQDDPRAIAGDEGPNKLIGDLNGNTLLGLGGDDTLIGLAGADRLDGGTGVDTADYSASADGVSIDLTAATASGGDAEGDTLIGIENLVGSAFGDTLAGGADRGKFLAGDGDDILVGGSWFDWMEGGAGNDIITGTGGQTVQFGDDGDDVMQGSLDNANYFAGGLGNDIMIGGNTTDYISDVDGGDDVMYGGGGADTLVDYYGANEMYGEDGDDFVSSVGSGSHLDGGAGNDYISVANGDYTLIGGAGNDTLEHAGHGHTSFTGGEGADTFTYRVFGNGPISYEVSDFEDGVDQILLWDYKYYGNVAFESLSIADSAAGAVISWNGSSEMTLLGIAADEITQTDFLMA